MLESCGLLIKKKEKVAGSVLIKFTRIRAIWYFPCFLEWVVLGCTKGP